MKRIYIAGPYSADNIMDVLKNIRQGQEAAAEVLICGHAVFCPFIDYQLALTRHGSWISKEMFQANSMAWLEVSDAVLLTDGWRNSEGTRKEIARANELGIPVFETIPEQWEFANKAS